jgi:long-chain-fatty-acid---luciferin-component ligase
VRSTAECGRVENVVIDATTDLDYLISGEVVFEIPLAEQRDLRERHVRAAFERHADISGRYGDFVRRQLGTTDLGSISLGEIPVIPTSSFKQHSVLSVAPEEISKWCVSSGTRGRQSTVGRDRRSLERLLGSIRAGISLIHSWLEDDVEVIHLGPERKEAGDIWFMYVMSLIELSFPTEHFVRRDHFHASEAIERIAKILKEGKQDIVVVGPPFRVQDLADAIERHQTRLDGGSRLSVVTAGGWKRLSGISVPRPEFDERISRVFGLREPTQIRDAFNQVELNTVFIECSAHRKHVPPWVYATTRDADRLRPQAVGTPGLLSYLDASAISYPAFIVTDDVGRVDEGECPCGRSGVTMTVERRLTRVSARGCALTLDKRTQQAGA